MFAIDSIPHSLAFSPSINNSIQFQFFPCLPLAWPQKLGPVPFAFPPSIFSHQKKSWNFKEPRHSNSFAFGRSIFATKKTGDAYKYLISITHFCLIIGKEKIVEKISFFPRFSSSVSGRILDKKWWFSLKENEWILSEIKVKQKNPDFPSLGCSCFQWFAFD